MSDEITEAYVYIYKNGSLKGYKGHVKEINGSSFLKIESTGRIISVSASPYTIHRDTLWMEERDYSKARDMFARHYEQKVKEHQIAMYRFMKKVEDLGGY